MKCTTLSDALFLPQNVRVINGILRGKEEEISLISPSVDSALDERALHPLLEEVAKEVNSFLDSGFGLPLIFNDKSQENSWYLNRKISIGYKEMFFNDIYALIAHEYVHHVAALCRDSGSNWNNSKALEDGIARGVELKIADLYSAKLDSHCFRKKALERASKDLAMFIDRAKGEWRPSKQGSDPMPDFFDIVRENIGRYKFGTSALLLAEQMHGDIVYRRLIKSTNPYRLLVGFLSGDVNP